MGVFERKFAVSEEEGNEFYRIFLNFVGIFNYIYMFRFNF